MILPHCGRPSFHVRIDTIDSTTSVCKCGMTVHMSLCIFLMVASLCSPSLACFCMRAHKWCHLVCITSHYPVCSACHQAVEQSLLFQFVVSHGLYPLDESIAVECDVIGCLQLADIHNSQETYCLLHNEVCWLRRYHYRLMCSLVNQLQCNDYHCTLYPCIPLK